MLVEADPENKTNRKKKTILVSGDVVIPDKYEEIWKDRRRIHIIKNDGQPSDGGKQAAYYWKVETSNDKYKTLGDIPFTKKDGNKYNRKSYLDDAELALNLLKSYFNYDYPEDYKGIVAVPKSCITKIVKNDTPEWSYKLDNKDNYDYGGRQIDIFGANNNNNIIRFNNFRINMNLKKKGGDFYKIDMNKIKHRNNPLKDTEPENNDLGFGYYGYPYLITDKYSIFKFLNLVPEGLIINYNNNRKLYIRHYGGVEMNRYNIFKYDTATGRYDKALRVNGPTNVRFSRMKPNDPRFSFSYEVDSSDSRFIRFKSISNPNDGYLKYISQITNTNYDSERDERPGGISIDSRRSTFELSKGEGEISNKNKKLFMFLQAHGRGLADKQVSRLNLKSMTHPGSKKNYTPITTTTTAT